MAEAKLLRATFYILSKQQEKAFDDLKDIIENQNASPKVRANALIKRASLFIQRCKDPQQDSLLSFKDFEKAIEIDPTNADVYHHRGQVKNDSPNHKSNEFLTLFWSNELEHHLRSF